MDTSKTFLPEGTAIPQKNDGYFKFELGDNRFRVVDHAVVGFELWVSGKPVRRKKEEFTPEELANADINKYTGKRKSPSYFWAFPVYNYKADKIQILEVTQIKVMRGIESYLGDEDYGKDPTKYDLVVVQDKADSKKIEYSVKAKPPKEIDPKIIQMYKDTPINLEALFTGENPFTSSSMNEDVDPDFMNEAVK